ncbi:MAG TPA: PhoU domain-containing protein, partial [Methanomassiliicoccaceae archaeon]|nr:PhoU domain-containing protein [Methanomassiliicoccaceae archaeon]
MGLEDMLLEIKDTSELMVDLAYSSLLYDNQEIAEEVIQLHGRMEELGDEIEELAIKRAIEDRDSPKALATIRMSKSV